MQIDKQNPVDPWLYPGCPCWCWNNGQDNKDIMLFEKISGIGENIFYTTQNKGVYMFDHYRPIGTPWDFAPDTARFIDINSEGVCSFQETEEDGSYIVDKWLQLPYLILWRECPEHLKGRILPRPEWAGGNN